MPKRFAKLRCMKNKSNEEGDPKNTQRVQKESNFKSTLSFERPSGSLSSRVVNVESPESNSLIPKTPNLHSTLIDNNSSCVKKENADNAFSTTIVSGMSTCNPRSVARLGSLSDVTDAPTLSVTRGNESQLSMAERHVPTLPECKEDTIKDNLRSDYLQYLTWMYLDLRAKEAHETQVEQAKNQMKFLKQLVDEKQEEVKVEKQKLKLVNHFEKVNTFYDAIKVLFVKFNATAHGISPVLDSLGKNLETKLSNIKINEVLIRVSSNGIADLHEELTVVLKNVDSIQEEIQDDFEMFTAISNVSDSLGSLIEDLETDLKSGEELATATVKQMTSHIASGEKVVE